MRQNGKYLILRSINNKLYISDYTRRLCYEYAKLIGCDLNGSFFSDIALISNSLDKLLYDKIMNTIKYSALKQFYRYNSHCFYDISCAIECNIRVSCSILKSGNNPLFFRYRTYDNLLNNSSYLEKFPESVFNDIFDIIEEYIKEKDDLLYKKIIVDYVKDYKEFMKINNDLDSSNIDKYTYKIQRRTQEHQKLERGEEEAVGDYKEFRDLETIEKEIERLINELIYYNNSIKELINYEKYLMNTFGEYLN